MVLLFAADRQAGEAHAQVTYGSGVAVAPGYARRAYEPDRVVVRFRPGTTGHARRDSVGRIGARVVRTIPGRQTRLLDLRDESVSTAVNKLERDPDVMWAEPEYIGHVTKVSNDRYLSEQYSLHNFGQSIGQKVTGTADADMDVPEAWEHVTGDPRLLVAVVDTGIDYRHPDLASNLAINRGESGAGREANGVDDDHNGFVDDFRGYDFVDDDNDVRDEGPFPHGTLASAIIAARGNNATGVSGVAQRAAILPLRAATRAGSLASADVAAAFAYACARGARIVNGSFGFASPPQVVSDAIAAAPRSLFVISSGNDASTSTSRGTGASRVSSPTRT